MSTAENVVDSARLPSFALDYGFDDAAEPTSVTIFEPGAEDCSTAWLTMDTAHTVPLEDVA